MRGLFALQFIRKSGFNQRSHGIGSDLFNHHDNMKHGDNNYLGDSEAGSCLPSADAAETRLVLDNAIGNSHLAAQSGQEHNQLK